MGGVISVVEIILMTGMLGQQIAEAVLRSQIKAMVDAHAHEFQLMDELYTFMEVLIEQTNLMNQLDLCSSFCTKNWSAIRDDLDRKNTLLKKITNEFPDVNTSDYAFTFKDGLVIVATGVVLGFMSYNFVSGNKKTKVSTSSKEFKGFFEETSNKVKNSAPQIKSSKYKPETGDVQIKNNGKQPANAPDTRKSEVNETKKKEKSKVKSKVTMGLRVVMIGVMVFAFVKGVQNLMTLKNEVDKYKEYFSEGGEFDQSKEGIIELMNYTAGDIFNLGCASRGAYYDTRNSLYVMSITSPQQQETVLAYAKMLDPVADGLTDEFTDKSLILVQNSSTIAKKNINSEQKLVQMQQIFRTFYDKYKPEIVFSNVGSNISAVTGKFSVISPSVINQSNDVNSWLIYIQNLFSDYRTSNFENLSDSKKKGIDTDIIKDALLKYQELFDEPEVQIEDINNNTKNILFNAIISFAETFYYDDPSGATLFGKNIKEKKNLYPYDELLSMEAQAPSANLIPVCKYKESQEKAEREKWVNMAIAENSKLPADKRMWPLDVNSQQIKVEYRYIRLQLEKYTNPQGQSYDFLVGNEGTSMKYAKELYSIERNVMSQVTVLEKASEPQKPKP